MSMMIFKFVFMIWYLIFDFDFRELQQNIFIDAMECNHSTMQFIFKVSTSKQIRLFDLLIIYTFGFEVLFGMIKKQRPYFYYRL